MTVALVVAATGLTVTGSEPVLAGPAAPSCPGSATDGVAASVVARACARRVLVTGSLTATSAVYAEPSGGYSLEQNVVPVRVHRDSGWVPVDTTLTRRPDGTVQPAAVPDDLRFSGGGTGPLVRLSQPDRTVTMMWPTALPAPSLQGDTAVYAGVLPGVDLRVRATTGGFQHVLVIKNRQAAANPALKVVHYGLSATGVTLRQRAGGGLDSVAPDGSVASLSSGALMWDDGPPGAVAGAGPDSPEDAAATVAAPMTLAGADLAIVPDATMLSAAKTTFPVYLDPDFPGHLNRWSYADTSGSDRNDGVARVGLNPDGSGTFRSFFEFSTGGITGKHVLSAVFRSTLVHSYSCGPTPVSLYWTGGISVNGVRSAWSPALVQWLDEKSGNANKAGGCGTIQPDMLMEFSGGLTGLMQTVANNGTGAMTFGLSARSANGANESATDRWKKFSPTGTSLTVTYNSVPTMPDKLDTHNQGCATGAGRPVLATGTPTLKARMNDVDAETDLRANFAWQQYTAATNTWTAVSSADTAALDSGAPGQVTVGPALAAGIYRWRVQTADPWAIPGASGTDNSPVSGWCEFEVDTTPPNQPAVTADPENTPFVAGKTIRLHLAPGGSPADTDITGYTWWVVDGQGTHASSFAAGATTTIDWTPISGQGTINVVAKDRVQTGPARPYAFNAAQPSTEVARWPLNDGAGGTTLVDSTGNQHDATLTGTGTLGAPGRTVNGDTALSMGGTGYATTPAPVIDTSRNFTVSAWVKLDRNDSYKTAVSADGGRNSSFALQYVADVQRWAFTLPRVDADGWTATRIISSSTPVLGVWTHLTGVYDSGAGTAKLYVNGVLEGQAGGATAFTATGPFAIGRAKTTGIPCDQWPGSLYDVRVWDRALSDIEAAALADPVNAANQSRDNTGHWLFNEGNGSTAFDSSAYFHDLTLNLDSGVGWTSAGHSGSALALTGGGAAQSDGPVLYTDQSFTASAWVKMTGSTLSSGTMTAVSQDAGTISGFYLGYRQRPAGPSWCLLMHTSDSPSSPSAAACTTTALTTSVLNTWVHLVGTYDAATGHLALYVNGTRADDGTAVITGRWNAAGPMAVGRAMWTPVGGGSTAPADYWVGAIDDVTVYVGAAPATEVAALP
jgi:hypothetical protein